MSSQAATRVDSRAAAANNRGASPPRQKAPSRDALQRAAAILEVLAGQRSTADAAQALGVSLPRYYLLEQQALDALVEGCEPRNRGPRASPERQIERLRKEVDRLRRETARQQALLRAAQRTIGLRTPPPSKSGPSKAVGGRRRRRKPTARALKAADALRSQMKDAAPATAPPATER